MKKQIKTIAIILVSVMVSAIITIAITNPMGKDITIGNLQREVQVQKDLRIEADELLNTIRDEVNNNLTSTLDYMDYGENKIYEIASMPISTPYEQALVGAEYGSLLTVTMEEIVIPTMQYETEILNMLNEYLN